MIAPSGKQTSYGYLKSAKKAAQALADAHRVSIVIYPNGKGKTHHIYPKQSNPGGPLDTHAARELELYVENDAQLHRSQEQPIQKNLITKMARGVYNHSGAVKLYGYLMESGAKKYAKEYSGGSDWHQIFSSATRKAAAEVFAKSFETEAKLGNYDHLLPKKYAGWSGKTGTIPNGRLVPARIKHNGHTYSGKVKRVNGKVKIFVTPEVARKINPEAVTRFRDLPIGARFRMPGGYFLGQDTYTKTGTRSYVPANTSEAERDLRSKYSGYPDILKKLKGSALRKAITLKVGSLNAKVEI